MKYLYCNHQSFLKWWKLRDIKASIFYLKCCIQMKEKQHVYFLGASQTEAPCFGAKSSFNSVFLPNDSSTDGTVNTRHPGERGGCIMAQQLFKNLYFHIYNQQKVVWSAGSLLHTICVHVWGVWGGWVGAKPQDCIFTFLHVIDFPLLFFPFPLTMPHFRNPDSFNLLLPYIALLCCPPFFCLPYSALFCPQLLYIRSPFNLSSSIQYYIML